ncbi:MAG: HipA family kinase [Chthoniobacteraceae bacterium]
MKISQVTAIGFLRALRNGRTRPLLLNCQNVLGEDFEVVTKFRGREMDGRSQLVELVSAQLADDLGLDVPGVAVVDIPTDFAEIISDADDAAMVRQSVGLNFGSIHFGQGFTTWPPERAPHGAQRDQAAAIFAFDTLTQNPDRRAQNPNLWSRSDRLGVYDHEQAFSFLFLPIIGGAPRPWNPADQAAGFPFLENHIFYGSLRSSRFDLDPFEERLSDLSDSKLQSYIDSVPASWREGNDLCEQISAYLQEARQERKKLIGFVKHILR